MKWGKAPKKCHNFCGSIHVCNARSRTYIACIGSNACNCTACVLSSTTQQISLFEIKAVLICCSRHKVTRQGRYTQQKSYKLHQAKLSTVGRGCCSCCCGKQATDEQNYGSCRNRHLVGLLLQRLWLLPHHAVHCSLLTSSSHLLLSLLTCLSTHHALLRGPRGQGKHTLYTCLRT